MENKYAVIIEAPENEKEVWGAYVPDLPGCIATADSLEEVRELIRNGLRFHVEALREAGEPVPAPSTIVDEVAARSSDVGRTMSTAVTVHPIYNREDLDAALARLDGVFMAKAGTPEADEREVLALMIEAFVARHYSMKKP